MVLAHTDKLAGVSRSDGVLDARPRENTRQPVPGTFAMEWLEIGHPTAMQASSFGHPTPWQLNKLGNYHCNNRVYSIGHARWLSPDQAASPFFNLFGYVGGRPLQTTDPAGLKIVVKGRDNVKDSEGLSSKEILTALQEICPGANLTLDENTGEIKSVELCKGQMVGGPGGCPAFQSGWVRIAGTHIRGCELLGGIICSEFTVTINGTKSADQNKYTADKYKGGATPEGGGWKDKKNADGKVIGKEQEEMGEHGKGSGGTVDLEKSKGDYINRKGNKTRGGTRELARVLAHELGHAWHGIKGRLQVESTADSGRFSCTGTDLADWRDLEEYDTIKEWENPIAKEILDEKTRKGEAIPPDTWTPAEGY